MTGRRNDAVSLSAAVAIAALLLLGAFALSACGIDPDGGASLNVAKEYAPTPVKVNVLEDMKAQDFSFANYLYTYVTYPALEDTGTVAVVGLMYGPSGQKGVLDIYKALTLKIDDKGFWKITNSVKGTPAAGDLPPTGETSGTAAETSGSAETTAK